MPSITPIPSTFPTPKPTSEYLCRICVAGTYSLAGHSECTNCSGTNHVDPDGSNHWVAGAATNQSYLLLQDADVAGSAIDKLLCQPPKRQGRGALVED